MCVETFTLYRGGDRAMCCATPDVAARGRVRSLRAAMDGSLCGRGPAKWRAPSGRAYAQPSLSGGRVAFRACIPDWFFGCTTKTSPTGRSLPRRRLDAPSRGDVQPVGLQKLDRTFLVQILRKAYAIRCHECATRGLAGLTVWGVRCVPHRHALIEANSLRLGAAEVRRA